MARDYEPQLSGQVIMPCCFFEKWFIIPRESRERATVRVVTRSDREAR